VKIFVERRPSNAATVSDLLIGDTIIALLGKELDRFDNDRMSPRFVINDDAHGVFPLEKTFVMVFIV
jgi:hypothetical protein